MHGQVDTAGSGELPVEEMHPPRQAPRRGGDEHGESPHVGRLNGVGTVGERHRGQDRRIPRRLPGRGHPLAPRPRDRQAIPRIEEVDILATQHRRDPGPQAPSLRIAGREHDAVEPGVTDKLEKHPRPLGSAGPTGEEDLSQREPPCAGIGVGGDHRRVARGGQRADRPLKQRPGDGEILDRIPPGAGGDIG